MKRGIFLYSALLLFSPLYLRAQEEKPARTIEIEEVTVEGRRILRDVGAQKTVLDSTSLREDVTRSLADVLSQSSSIFIKSYGRATLSTASFRGTAPSHTQVTWNDMNINSPMLGMVDFSLIPSYLVDNASVYHGTSSVGVTGGGLGGAVTLATTPMQEPGIDLRYIQGISSYKTFDEFLRFAYAGRKWQSSTRVMYSSSDNNFKYTNYNKKLPVLDENGMQTGEFYRPRERNKNGSFNDLHVLQEVYYKSDKGDRFNIAAWYLQSSRGIPMLNADYKEEGDYRNRQKENTLRVVAGWERMLKSWKLYARGGYTYTDMSYQVEANKGNDDMASMINARSYVNTAFGKAGADYYIGEKWLFTADATLHQHFVKSIDRDIMVSGNHMVIGYDKARTDLSLFASARYRPFERMGVSLSIREEMHATTWAPIIPALFAEYSFLRKRNLTLKASVSRNYRHPTLNDLYYMPGGNPELRPEKGMSWDSGLEYKLTAKSINLSLEATYYASRIKDWILWIPSFKGYWTPVNKNKVHSSGIELKGKLNWDLGREWRLYLDANYTIARAINKSDPVNENDNSVDKQLVYIPRYSNAVTGKLSWKRWTFTYRYNYYSERFTSSDNNKGSIVGRIHPYYMSDIALERSISTKWIGLNLKVAVNNLFNEEYESVLSRPMAGRNFGFFIEIIPKLKRTANK